MHISNENDPMAAIKRFERAVDQLAEKVAANVMSKAARADRTLAATKAAAVAREHTTASGADIMKRALAGDPEAQAIVRDAVQKAANDTEQADRAANVYKASVTGRVPAVRKVSAAIPLPTRQPTTISPERLHAAVPRAVEWMLNRGLNLGPNDVLPLPPEVRAAMATEGSGGPAAALAEWLARVGRVELDPLTGQEIQRRIPEGPGTGPRRA